MNLGYLRHAITHQSLGQVVSHYAYRSVQRLFDVSVFRCLLVQDSTVIRNPVRVALIADSSLRTGCAWKRR